MKTSNSKNSVVDGIPSFFSKSCHSLFSAPLCYLFNLILSIFPTFWKVTKIVPVKIGEITNYRLLSCTSNFGKIFERPIIKYLNSSMSPIIVDEQYGCMCTRSTITNLVSNYLINLVAQCINRNTSNGY